MSKAPDFDPGLFPWRNSKIENGLRPHNRTAATRPARIQFERLRAPATRAVRIQLAGNDEVDRFGAFALLVRFNVEADPLSLVQSLQSRLFHRGDVNEHVTSAVIWFNEAIAPFTIEELHDTRLRHRENSSPQLLRRPHARQLGWTFTIGEGVGRQWPQSTPPAPTGGGTSLPMRNYTPTASLWKEAAQSLRDRGAMNTKPVKPETARTVAPKEAGKGWQQRRKLVFQGPWRVDDDHPGPIEPRRVTQGRHQKLDPQDLWDRQATQPFGKGLRLAAPFDRVPEGVDPGRPFAVCCRQPTGKMREIVACLKRWIDQHHTTAFFWRHIGVQRSPA